VFFPEPCRSTETACWSADSASAATGVDQDDFATSAGAALFPAPTNIRADQIIDQDVRLPYIKFPQNPTY